MAGKERGERKRWAGRTGEARHAKKGRKNEGRGRQKCGRPLARASSAADAHPRGRPSGGIEGIAAATSIAAWLNVGQMTFALWKRGWWRPGASVVRRLLRILLCAIALGAALGLASWARPLFQPWLLGRKELAVAATVIAGGALYILLLPLLRAVTPSEIRAALRRQAKPAGIEAAPEF